MTDILWIFVNNMQSFLDQREKNRHIGHVIERSERLRTEKEKEKRITVLAP